MKIEIDTQLTHLNVIESYSSSGIVINKTLYKNSLIVSPELFVENWTPQTLAELRSDHFSEIMAISPQIILIGTGKLLQFPDNDILMAIMSKNIGVEVMDTRAACRAYNLIAGEGRIVVAALLQIDT